MLHRYRPNYPASNNKHCISATLSCLLYIVLIAICLIWEAVPAVAIAGPGQDATTTIEPSPEIDTQRLAARITELSALEQNGDFPPASAQELALLRETQQFLQKGTTALATADKFTGEARSAPEQLAQIDTYLATPADQLVIQIDRSLPIEEFNAQIETARARLQSERDLRLKVDTDEQYRNARRTEIPTERSKSTERLDAISAELAAGLNPSDPDAIAIAKRWHALAEQFFHRATLRALDEELRNYDARRSLLEKRRTYRDRRITIETRNVTIMQEIIAAKQVEIAEATQREAAKQRREAANAHPLVKSILDQSQLTTARNTVILGLNGADTAARTLAEAQLKEWQNTFARSKTRVERVGLTNAIGQHLRHQRSRIPNTRELRQQMAKRDSQIGNLVNEAEDTAQMLYDLVDIDDAVQRKLEDYTGKLPENVDDREEIRLVVRDALLQQREYLNTLNTSINDYMDTTLLELQNTQRDLYNLYTEYIDFIEERVLWIRSTEVMHLSDIWTCRDAALSFVDKDAWVEIAANGWSDVKTNMVTYGLEIPLLLALILIHPLLRRQLQLIAVKTKRYTSDRFTLTVSALLITVLIAIALPASMAFVAWRLSIFSQSDSLGAGLSFGLFLAAELLFAAELALILCIPGGVGDIHFRWKQVTLRSVRYHLRWLILIVVPLAFVIGVTSPNYNYHNSLGRVAFCAMMIVYAVLLQHMLKPSSEILKIFLAQRRGGWLDRLNYVWYPLLILAPITTALVAGLGYFYSALQLEQRVLDTAWLLLLVVVGRALLLRGLLLAQRTLDIEQRKKKRAALALAEAEAGKTTAATSIPSKPALPESGADGKSQPVAESREIDVAAVSAQTRQLLNTIVVFALLIGLAVVWIDMLPALGFFQGVKLWTPDSGMPAVAAVTTGGGTEGDLVAAQTLEPTPITLGHVFYSILILMVTVLVSKNIPGLLEIVLLQRLPISTSGRYAITSIARYILVIVGMVMAFGAIGIGWSKVQWLAAAITVGLGFGLQEIFANFVSGLIILFERPIRVGDTVTVGGITGKVTRLHIRATTIIDWDRKELIVPNKEFVTGQIINWTLSDPILRIVIPVGIAYGSDTKLAEEILLQVARNQPGVLDEPEPTVLFDEFGDSSLNFKLRVFIPHIDSWFAVRHRLHNSIDQEFKKAGIVIAFPQLDVHMQQPPQIDTNTEE